MPIDPRTVRLLDAKHRPHARDEIDRLREVDLLRELVRDTARDGERVRALHAYVATGQPDALRLVSDVLHDAHESDLVRAGAATCIGHMGSVAEEPLLRGLDTTPPPLVRLKIAKSLGRLGGPASIEPLVRLAATTEGDVRLQATFALQLVAHRYGVRELANPPAYTELLDASDMKELTPRLVGSDYLRWVVGLIGADCFGIAPSTDRGVDFECTGSQLSLLLNGEQNSPLGLAELALRRPLILGLVAARSPEDGSRFVSRILLAGPLSDDTFYVAIHRTDGRLVHTGTGVIKGDEGDVSIRSAAVAGNFPLHVRARLRPDAIVWDLVQAGTRLIGSRPPDPFAPESARHSATSRLPR